MSGSRNLRSILFVVSLATIHYLGAGPVLIFPHVASYKKRLPQLC